MYNAKYKFSSTHVDVPKALSGEIKEWGIKIPDNDIFTVPGEPFYGREDEIHTTVLYGIHERRPEKIASVIRNFGEVSVALNDIGIFSNPKYDVIFVKCTSDDLDRLRKLLIGNFDYTDSYKRYEPHITIAYVKKDMGWKYYGNHTFAKRSFTINKIVFSSVSGEKYEILLRNE